MLVQREVKPLQEMDRAGSDIDRLYKWLAEAVSLSW